MCGIAGFVASRGKGRSSCAPAVLRAIEHRGPDDHGWLRLTDARIERGRQWSQPGQEPEVLLLHRRLSILDTSEAGWQPMSSADGRYEIVYNGEIYNYKEIRTELEAKGRCFQSHSDTEVLLAAYAEWGTQALTRFIGMFAFALLDVRLRTLILVRDFFGIKPLYYAAQDGFFCFGSEIKTLIAFGIGPLRANPERLLYYLRYGMTDFGAETMLADIQQLPPAHFLEISLDDIKPWDAQPYWHPDRGGELDISFEEAAAQLRELFLRSVELHLRSDVPLGSALSGGIDSSAIVMAIRHLDSQAEIHAFSFISEDEATSEERWIDIVGHAAGAEVHKIHATSDQLAGDLDAMMRFHDEPFSSTSAYAQFEVFRAAHASGIKVMLDGQGADEILGGYKCYQGARLASLLRQGEWSQAFELVRNFAHHGGVGTAQGLAFCADYILPPSLQSAARKLAGKDLYPSWIRRGWFEQRGVGPHFINYTTAPNVLRDSLSRSLAEGLPLLLRYEDRNSMASSVESRVPFLTPELVSFLGRLPERYLIAEDGTSKAVFRQAMRGIVPDAILDRRDKIGFVTPEKRWLDLLDGWVRSVLATEAARRMPFLDIAAAAREWDAVRQGRRPYDSTIWRWINLIRWTEELGISFS